MNEPAETNEMMEVSSGKTDLWRDQDVLIMRREAKMPSRCVGCNAPSNGAPLRVKVRWLSPAFYLILVAGAVFAILTATSSAAPNPEYTAGRILGVALVVFLFCSTGGEKSAHISVPLCPSHFARYSKRRRIVRNLIGVTVLVPAAIAGTVAILKRASAAEAALSFLIAAAFMLVLIFFLAGNAVFRWVRIAAFLRARRIDEHFLWLRGACPEFLATLPLLPSSPASSVPSSGGDEILPEAGSDPKTKDR